MDNLLFALFYQARVDITGEQCPRISQSARLFIVIMYYDTSTKLTYFTGVPLKQRKQSFQTNVTKLKIQTGRRQRPVGYLQNLTEDLNLGQPRNKSR